MIVEVHEVKTPDKSYVLRLYVNGLPGHKTLERGDCIFALQGAYQQAVTAAEEETKNDGRTRWVVIELMIRETVVAKY